MQMTTVTLPEIGFVRLPQIIGQVAVTEDQALRNRAADKGLKRPRAAIPALIPVKKSTWWEWVKDGRAPKPLKLSNGVTVWKVEAIRELVVQLDNEGRGK